MKNLPDHVEQSVQRRDLFRRVRRIMVAVSGGVDSMVLLRVLRMLAPKHRWALGVAHFNHRLRGRSSDADERLVRTTAEEYGLPFFSDRAEVREFARNHKLSVEMAARQLRHEFLARAVAQFQAGALALAHQADDQVELFFIRLLRGSGMEGISGMRWQGRAPWSVSSRKVAPEGASFQLVRPFLDVPKADLEMFARENRVRFRNDSSNRNPDILRNRIRHELLPLLRRQYQPAVDRTVLRIMDLARAEAEFVRTEAEAWLGKGCSLPFAKLPLALQRWCLRLQARREGIEPDYDLVERLRRETKPVTVRPGIALKRDENGRLRLRREVCPPDTVASCVSVALEGGAGRVLFDGIEVRWRIVRSSRLPPRRPGREFFDADQVGPRILLRHWLPGDRFQPIGLGHRLKLQDLFTNQKVPREQRRSLLLGVTAAGEPFWVENLRISERFKLSKRTIRRLQWQWHRL